jgi:Cyclin, N-terminal domain
LGAKPSITGKTSIVPAAKPLSRQNSRAGDSKKEKNVKSITEQITIQIKKTTAIASQCIESKKEKVTEWPLIRSPVSMKLKKEREITEGQKFFESHSTYLLQQVSEFLLHTCKKINFYDWILFHQVENIDENDRGNPQLVSEYVNDIYAYLMKVETAFPIRTNFLDTQMDVTPKMRTVLLDWINEVHHQFNLENETFHMAVSMLDRYLQSVSSTPRRYLQLVGVTALFMASKVTLLNKINLMNFCNIYFLFLVWRIDATRNIRFCLCYWRHILKGANSSNGDENF